MASNADVAQDREGAVGDHGRAEAAREVVRPKRAYLRAVLAAASEWERASVAYLAVPVTASLLEQGDAYAVLRRAEDGLVAAVRMARHSAEQRRAKLPPPPVPPLLVVMGEV